MGRLRKNPINVTKKCPTCDQDFVIKYSKKHQIYCSKSCSQKSPDVVNKIKLGQKQTFLKKYGVEHPMMTNEVKNNFKKSMLDNHGVEHPSHMVDHKEKVRLSLIEKYGDENYNNIDQMKKTMLERYGVDNYRKTQECSNKIKSTCLKKYGVDHSSKRNEFKHKHYANMFIKFEVSPQFENFTPMFELSEYQGVTRDVVRYKFKCNRCNVIDLHSLTDGHRPLCKKCDKDVIFKKQNEVYLFLKELLKDEVIVVGDRTLLYPQEIDLYIPSKKLAIEFDGLYWHSELSGGKNKMYHLMKTKKCLGKEVECVHIFENEWNDKKEIVKSILKNKLIGCDNKLYARNCVIKLIDKEECKKFLTENHLQGNDKSFLKIGLYHDDVLVSVMTFCKSRYNKNYEYEMSRYCNKLNTNVVGGSKKLFSYFLKTYKPKTVISYSDRRYFSGNVYLGLNFNFIDNTSPNYFYITNNYKNIIGRLGFQKHRLSKVLSSFDKNLSEWENMKLGGYDRIWDCGHSKWIYFA